MGSLTCYTELTPDMHAHHSTCKFTNFHRASRISIKCITLVSFLDCQYVQRLFETLYNSSFYDIVQKFELMDACTHSYAANLPDSNAVEIILQNNPVSERQLLLYLTLSSYMLNNIMVLDSYFHVNATLVG